MPPITITCEDCAWWEDLGFSEGHPLYECGECRRYAPVPHSTFARGFRDGSEAVFFHWPATHKDGHCGDANPGGAP
jgi:hypothetical protein